jgi:hypothetical protein
LRELQLIVAIDIQGAITTSSIVGQTLTIRLKAKRIKRDSVKNIKMRLASRAILHKWLGGRGGSGQG